MKKVKNPLIRRLPRELRSEWGRYLAVFLMITGMIAICSGYFVADSSMIAAYQEGFTKYNVEDGHFRTQKRLNKAQNKEISGFGVTLYDNYYIEESMENGSTLRIYRDRDQVDMVCLMSGELPRKTGEIALDRMYADNCKYEIGDTVCSDGRSWIVTGLVALPDYSCLYENNSDPMFDALMFGVAIVSDEEFDAYPAEELFYNYAWKYDHVPADETEERDMSDAFLKNLNQTVSLEDYVALYENMAISFTGEDMEGDMGMIYFLLYILIAILAFVVGITTANTIEAESNVIGTLRAMGYTRGELIRHYMMTPVAVTLVGALIGNLIGYTLLTDFVAQIYYGSYSLPTFVPIWNADAFLETTVVPLALMVVINYLVLARKLRLSPQQFLRRDTSSRKKKKTLPLPERIPFFRRFGMRVILQNIPNYIALLFGILFANLILLFGLGFPAILEDYQVNITNTMLAKYQYMLNVPVSMTDDSDKLESLVASLQFLYEVDTDNPDAEKFSANTLKTQGKASWKADDVTVYGIDPDSRYVDLDFSGDKIYISSAYADKYWLDIGDVITLKDTYEGTSYSFTVDGILEYDGAVCIFMGREHLNSVFGYDKDMFVGYFSDSPITDIEDRYIGSVIDETTMTKLSRQLTRSMGQLMKAVVVFAVVVFLVLIYLLSKIIIEKNAQSISMAKVLGYSGKEIWRLYILPTGLIFILLDVLTLPLEKAGIVLLFHEMMLTEMTGWMPLYVDNSLLTETVILGMISYAVIALAEYARIRRIPMEMALKTIE